MWFECVCVCVCVCVSAWGERQFNPNKCLTDLISHIKTVTEKAVCLFLAKIVVIAVLIIFLQATFSIQSNVRHTFERRKGRREKRKYNSPSRDKG